MKMSDLQKKGKKNVHFSNEIPLSESFSAASSIPSNTLPLLSRSSRNTKKSPKNSLSVSGTNALTSNAPFNER